MPNKCPFCQRKYSRSGAYQKHLRNAHTNLDIVLASIIKYVSSLTTNDNKGSNILPHEGHLHLDSAYESDPVPTGYAYGAFDDISHEPDTEILNETASPLPSKPMLYEVAGESIGDVNGFEQEQSNLCQHPWSPFSSAHGFKLASWFIEGKVPKSGINEYFLSGLGNASSAGYSSMHTLENLLQALDPHSAYLQWNEGQVDDGKQTLPFIYRNVLDCIRYLLRQITYRDDFIYAPRREYDTNGQWIYAEMHTADWWRNLPVQPHNPFLSKQSLTETRRHFRQVRRLFRSSRCLIRRISQTSPGDKKAWPVYITLGNLPSGRRNSPTSIAVLLLALLPIPSKLSKSSKAD